MTVSSAVVCKIVRNLILGQDYRSEVVALIDAHFLEYAIEFFKRVAEAKMRGQQITSDWYREAMLADDLTKEEIALHSGLNIKTIQNMYNTTRREIVLTASREHYGTLYQVIRELTDEADVSMTLTIKFRNVAIDLDIHESLIVINTLAVARAAMRGSIWSTAGKQVEKPLMVTLCRLHKVPPRYYTQESLPEHQREVDFYLTDVQGTRYRCEVKLMGKGNPESTDAALARDANIFIADKLSDRNKQQLAERGILWMELRGATDLSQFAGILQSLGIPFTPALGDLEAELDRVLEQLSEEMDARANPFAVREATDDYIA